MSPEPEAPRRGQRGTPPAPLIFVHGTWGRSDIWWRYWSPFARAAEVAGLKLASPEPWVWSGRIGGLPEALPDDSEDILDDAGLLEWANEGRHLVHYAAAMAREREVSIIAHSHGGNVAVVAIILGLYVRHFVTVSTPPRDDLDPLYRRVKEMITGEWWHVRGARFDPWMWLGQFGEHGGSWRRSMPHAHRPEIILDEHDHSSMLVDGTAFEQAGIWAFLAS